MNTELYNLVRELSATDARKCMQCGKCSARCPNFDKFDIKPHQFVNMVRKGQFELLAQSQTIHYCLTCMECVERCPRMVAPADLINAIKDLSVRQNPAFLTADDIPEMLDDDMPQQLLVSAFRKFS